MGGLSRRSILVCQLNVLPVYSPLAQIRYGYSSNEHVLAPRQKSIAEVITHLSSQSRHPSAPAHCFTGLRFACQSLMQSSCNVICNDPFGLTSGVNVHLGSPGHRSGYIHARKSIFPLLFWLTFVSSAVTYRCASDSLSAPWATCTTGQCASI
jgi:hypothetical protein